MINRSFGVLAGFAAFVGVAFLTFWGLMGLFGYCSTEHMPYREPQLMVNDQVYFFSGYPPDFVFYRGDFKVIGEVEEEIGVEETLARNFQAYGFSEGTRIYYDSQIPYMVYAERYLGYTRLVTDEALNACLYHNGMVYVALIRLDYDEQRRYYRPVYGDEDWLGEIPEDAIYIGETKFVGYNMLVGSELENNHYYEPQAVYQDRHNPCRLYGGDGMVFVPRLK